jgi:hypothetical protein
MFQFPASCFAFHPSDKNNFHTTTVVCMLHDDSVKFYNIDAYLNYHFEYENGAWIPIDDLYDILLNNDYKRVVVKQETIRRPIILIQEELDTIDRDKHYVWIDIDSMTEPKPIGNGLFLSYFDINLDMFLRNYQGLEDRSTNTLLRAMLDRPSFSGFGIDWVDTLFKKQMAKYMTFG